MAGAIDGIVTAPINKEALNAAGHAYAGHTEILAELTGSKGSCMLLAHDRLKVSHVTTHVALADVPKRDHARAPAPGLRPDPPGDASISASQSRGSASPRSTRTPARTACSAARTST